MPDGDWSGTTIYPYHYRAICYMPKNIKNIIPYLLPRYIVMYIFTWLCETPRHHSKMPR